jgi:hypothetical protein
MFGVGPATRSYLAVGTTDMQTGFEGLYSLVRDRLQGDPSLRSSDRFAAIKRPHIWVRQCGPQPVKAAVLGWKRAVGMCETFGARPIPVAGGRRRSIENKADA